MNKTAVVVIPVYNEAGTIGAMLEQLAERTFKETDWSCSVLVVDGNSSDGTAQIVREAQKKHDCVHLLVEEKKEGIGAAYFKGFAYAVERLGARVLIEFDGDFQHPPETIPRLLEKIDEGADLVLGSRKRPGGSYPENWDRFRLFLSKFGGFVARVLLFFPSRSFWYVTDPTTGLKATRVNEKFKKLDFSSFASRGFGYKIEMLFRLVERKAVIAEIPLRFQSREEGKSKMTGQTPFDILRTALVLRLKAEDTRNFFKFAVVGLSGYVVNALLLELFVRMPFVSSIAGLFRDLAGLPYLGFIANPAGWAAALAIEGSIINNFIWNNFWTFEKRRARRAAGLLKRFAGFNLAALGSVVIQFLSLGLTTHYLGNTLVVRQVALALTIALLVVPYNWCVYNRLIWRKKPEAPSSDRPSPR
jgi:dolichol-phosphate mannosyltransferase